jgi:hypothetical protein
MDNILRCMFQVIPPSKETNMGLNCNGVGDCDGRFTGVACTPHPDNQHCRKFFPIRESPLWMEDKD